MSTSDEEVQKGKKEASQSRRGSRLSNSGAGCSGITKLLRNLKNNATEDNREIPVFDDSSSLNDSFDDKQVPTSSKSTRRLALPIIDTGAKLLLSTTTVGEHFSSIKRSLMSSSNQEGFVLADEPSRAESPAVTSTEDFLRIVSRAKNSDDYCEITHLYGTWFNSYTDLSGAFQDYHSVITGKSAGINWDLVRSVYANLLVMPQSLQKSTLKSIINSLLCDQRSFDAVLTKPIHIDNLRAYIILLQNPQFRRPSTYVVFAHLLRQLATLCEPDQVKLTQWLSEWNRQTFSNVVSMIQLFISVRLYPPRPQDLPPANKCAWWIPCAVRVLAIFNATNTDIKVIIPMTEFYNISLDHWDLMNEFHVWESPAGNSSFSFCQYPFILSITAKRHILEAHAEQQMIASARDAIIGNLIATMRTPDVDVLFLTITVRRNYLLEDSLQELSDKQGNLRKKLRVEFTGEPGLDMGGLTKEWFQLLVRKIFQPDYGMFVYYQKSEVFWFSTNERNLENLQEYHLIGIVMGLAVYNGVILDIRFPLCCYKKLLSPAALPPSIDALRSHYLGWANLTIDDLAQIIPDTAHGLRELLTYDGDVEEDFGVNFQANTDEFGEIRTVDLKRHGDEIPVTNENKKEYVDCYIDWFLNKGITQQFRSFYLGFHSVCASNVLLMLRPEEVEMLVCGNPCVDFGSMQKITVYDGYTANDKTIKHFWDLILKLPLRHQRRLLLFATGSDRIPAGGIKDMTFKISKMVSSNPVISPLDMLPIARTCFNQLILPDYQDRQLLRQKLAIALAHGEGFGLE